MVKKNSKSLEEIIKEETPKWQDVPDANEWVEEIRGNREAEKEGGNTNGTD